MIPILFNYNATSFATHGIGDLMETLRCESVVNAEGEYELELDYPAGGEFIDSLLINNIIYAKVDDHGNWQAFRIYGIDKAINNLVTVHAQHLSYDLACVPVKAYKAATCSQAVAGLKTNSIGNIATPFTFTTNVTAPAHTIKGTFELEEPRSLRSVLLDGSDSIKGTFGGDLVFDNYNVSLLSVGGEDRGVLVEYGIDLIDMDQEESISQMITGVYPYWKGKEQGDQHSSEEKIVYGDIQYAAGTFKRHRIIPLNVTEYYPNNDYAPSVSEINQTAREWIAAEEIGQPEINLKLSYAELGKDVRLHDAITVRFVNIGINVMAKVVSYRYDVLKERCVEVEVGNVKPSILFSLEDASRLKRGLLPPERIQNNSITSSKIGSGAVGSGQISDGAVITRSLDDYAVTGAKIGSGAVTESKIGGGAVTESKIGGGAVTESKIAANAVTEPKINKWAVTTDKLGDMAVTTAKIKDGNITSGKISDNAVITGKIANGAVVEAKIGNSAITSAKIQDGAVINAKVGAAAITTEKVKDLAIDSAKIGNSAITSAKIQDGAVINAKVGVAAITTEKVKDLAIDSAKIGNSAITSAKIQDGAVINAKVGAAAITTEKVKDLAIDSAKIGNSAITSVKIKDGSVVDGKIGYHAINYDNVKDAQIDQLKLNDFSITSEKVSEGGWHTNPDGTRVWVPEPAIGTDSMQNSAVVSMKIGDREVGYIKMIQDVEDGIAAVWELDRLSANWITADQLDLQIMRYGGYGISYLYKDGYRYLIAM